MKESIPVLRPATDPHAWTENKRNAVSLARCVDTFGCIKGDLKALTKRERDFVMQCLLECFPQWQSVCMKVGPPPRR